MDVGATIDDRDKRVVYTGPWTPSSADDDYKGTTSKPTANGAAASLTFNGVGVSVHGTLSGRGNNNSKPSTWIFEIDNKFASNFTDPPPHGRKVNQTFFQSLMLPFGKHELHITVDVENDAQPMLLDYFSIYETSTTSAPSSPTSFPSDTNTTSAPVALPSSVETFLRPPHQTTLPPTSRPPLTTTISTGGNDPPAPGISSSQAVLSSTSIIMMSTASPGALPTSEKKKSNKTVVTVLSVVISIASLCLLIIFLRKIRSRRRRRHLQRRPMQPEEISAVHRWIDSKRATGTFATHNGLQLGGSQVVRSAGTLSRVPVPKE